MSIEDCERKLRAAREAANKRTGTIPERVAAYELVLQAERELAQAKGQPYAIRLDIGILPEAAVSEAKLVQTEYDALLSFSAVKIEVDGLRTGVGIAAVELVGCAITMFGYPNDEALPGHPLYHRGLSAYGIFEVIDSKWIHQLTEQNRVRFPSTPDSTQRHFIFTFHDSTFECIADDLRLSLAS